ncbi:MAG: ABC transporter permease [Candidatus Aureabacteria bacterium]|nr:ABC transporter permease [Candidatus Auribacterota bacterium]
MKNFIIRRLVLAVLTLTAIITLVFSLTRFIPGDPVYSFVGRRADSDTLNRVRSAYGLDDPVPAQFFCYIGQLLKGNLGYSYVTGQPVGKLIIGRFPNTLKLALTAMVFATLTGLMLGLLSASNPGGAIDRFCVLVSISGISVPVFWFGLILIIIFSNLLGWLPSSGMGNFTYIILPALTLGTRSAAYIARITRTSVMEVMGENFVITARAKGLSRNRILFKHILKNALIPVVTLIGVDLGSYLNGSVLTETIFGWNGVGNLALTGIMNRDYPLIMGTVLFGSFIFICANIIVDISYSFFNPKVTYE